MTFIERLLSDGSYTKSYNKSANQIPDLTFERVYHRFYCSYRYDMQLLVYGLNLLNVVTYYLILLSATED